MEFWTDRVKNEEVLHRFEGGEEYLAFNKRRKAQLDCSHFAYGLPSGPVTEGKIEERIQVTERLGRKLKHLLGDIKENRGYRKSKEEALGRSLWRTRAGRG